MQSAEHPDGVLGQQHNQTIMITGSQAQPQQPSQTPPIQQVIFRCFFSKSDFLPSRIATNKFRYFSGSGNDARTNAENARTKSTNRTHTEPIATAQ